MESHQRRAISPKDTCPPSQRAASRCLQGCGVLFSGPNSFRKRQTLLKSINRAGQPMVFLGGHFVLVIPTTLAAILGGDNQSRSHEVLMLFGGFTSDTVKAAHSHHFTKHTHTHTHMSLMFAVGNRSRPHVLGVYTSSIGRIRRPEGPVVEG